MHGDVCWALRAGKSRAVKNQQRGDRGEELEKFGVFSFLFLRQDRTRGLAPEVEPARMELFAAP